MAATRPTPPNAEPRLRPGRFRLGLERGAFDDLLALDVALTDHPQSGSRTGEREQGAKQQDLVETVQEALFGGCLNLGLGLLGQPGDGL